MASAEVKDLLVPSNHTAGIDGSIANTGSIGSPVDSFTTGVEVNDEDSHSGIKGSENNFLFIKHRR